MYGHAWPVDKTALMDTKALAPFTAKFLGASRGIHHVLVMPKFCMRRMG